MEKEEREGDLPSVLLLCTVNKEQRLRRKFGYF